MYLGSRPILSRVSDGPMSISAYVIVEEVIQLTVYRRDAIVIVQWTSYSILYDNKSM
jgi:hypothetical protein